jgi:isopenicillin N synthase-like dioxygenase
MLYLITKGTDKEIPSTPHRIIADSELAKESRYSIPFFMHPNHNMPLINLKTKKPVIAPNGKEMTESAMYVHWRLQNILPAGTVPDYETWKKGNDPFIVQ